MNTCNEYIFKNELISVCFVLLLLVSEIGKKKKKESNDCFQAGFQNTAIG